VSNEIQVSAFISRTTKALLERYVKATGVKKGRVIEMALLHHLQALQELPQDVVVPPRLVVTRQSWKKILREISSRKAPTRALRDLMRADGD